MEEERLFSSVLQEYHDGKKSGVLYASVIQQSEYLIRFYFEEGEIYHISFGPVKDRELLEILDCYDLKSKVFFEGQRAPRVLPNAPTTKEVIAHIRTISKTIAVAS